MLVHVRADEAEGWAECAVEPEPTYAAEFTDAAVLALRDHLVPRALAGPVGDAVALGPVLDAVRGHPMASRRAGAGGARRPAARRRSLAGVVARRHRHRRRGRVRRVGLHDDIDDLLAEADAALAAGAVRLRVKIAPGAPPSRFGRCATTSAPT